MALYERALQRIPGATQLVSRRPTRVAFGISPVYAEWARGARFGDVDGFEYIDWASGIGSILLGYADRVVDEAVCQQISRGTIFAVNHELELELAEELCSAIPCAEMVRYAKCGGEACAIAVRVARGVTGRDKIAFCGYHGWHDWYLAANLASDSPLDAHLFAGIEAVGVPRALAGTALPFPYGDLAALGELLERHRGEFAAVIMEPLRSEMPPEGYLAAVARLAREHDAVFILDEVSAGLRFSTGGAQQYLGVTPDMAVFAKSISNGYPMAAVVGKREVMEPSARMFISSTYWSDTIGLRAALTTIREARRRDVAGGLWRFGSDLKRRLNAVAEEVGLAVSCQGVDVHPQLDFAVADERLKRQVATLYIQEMAKRGCHGFTSFYLNAAQGQAELDQTLEAARDIYDHPRGIGRRHARSETRVRPATRRLSTPGPLTIGGSCMFTIEERGLIFDASQHPSQRRIACFTSLCVLSDGTVLCGYQNGPTKHAPDGTIQLSRSTDGGRTWEELGDTFETCLEGVNGSLATAELVEVAPGHLLLAATWFDRSDPDRPLFDPLTEGILKSKLLLATSIDGARCWSAWRELSVGELTGCASTGPIVRWSDGTIAIAFESFKEYDDPRPARHAAWLVVSRDGGRSFSRPLLVAQHPGHAVYYWDQRLAAGANPGEFLALFWTHDRTEKRDLDVHLRRGTIRGEAIELDAVRATAIAGQIAAPLLLEDGRLLAFVVNRGERGTMTLCSSSDGGRSWPADDRLVVYRHDELAALSQGRDNIDFRAYWEDMLKWSFGHPAMRRLPDGRLLLAWYAGVPDCMSLHWARVRVEEARLPK